MTTTSLKQTVHKHLFPGSWDKPKASPVTIGLLILILLSIAIFTFETEAILNDKYGLFFNIANVIIAVLFAIEYLLRLWTCTERPEYSGKWGRLKFALSWMAVIDLLAFLPALLFWGSASTYWLRLARVVRILRLLKLGRYSQSIAMVLKALKKGWRELTVTFGASMFFLYLSAVVLYFVEGDDQPEAFGSIPRAIWWSVATLTTVGYGDVYPITALGRFCAGIIALIGVAIVAMPAGILAGGFIEEYKAQRENDRKA